MGAVDDYLLSFDSQVERMRQSLAKDRQEWQSKYKANQRENAVMRKQIDGAMNVLKMSLINQQLCKPIEWTYQIDIDSLMDLENFGHPLKAGEEKFRWPTKEDLRKLDLNSPPKLREIHTMGVKKQQMTAIKLVF